MSGRRAFARLWTASMFAELGEWMLQIALPVFVYQATGSAGSTALTMSAGILPMVLVSPVVGVLADRCDRRRTMAGVCVAQAAVGGVLLACGGGSLALICVVLAVQAALASLFEPTRNALVPTLVDPGWRTAANGLMGVNSSVARLVGSALGGLVLGIGGLGWVLACYVGALLLACSLLVVPFSLATPGSAPSVAGVGLRSDWLAGLSQFSGNRVLRVVVFSLMVTSVAQGMFLVQFVVFVTGPLGGGEAQVGLLRGIQAVGGLAAGMLLATVGRRVSAATVLAVGLVGVAVVSAAIWNAPAVTGGFGVYLVLFALVGVPGVLISAGALTAIQAAVPAATTGRVLSTTFAATGACQTVGSLLAGALVATMPLTLLLNLHAAVILAAGVLAWLGLRSASRPMPPTADSHADPATNRPPSPPPTAHLTRGPNPLRDRLFRPAFVPRAIGDRSRPGASGRLRGWRVRS